MGTDGDLTEIVTGAVGRPARAVTFRFQDRERRREKAEFHVVLLWAECRKTRSTRRSESVARNLSVTIVGEDHLKTYRANVWLKDTRTYPGTRVPVPHQ